MTNTIKRVNKVKNGILFSGIEINSEGQTKQYPNPISSKLKDGFLYIGEDKYPVGLFKESLTELKALMITP